MQFMEDCFSQLWLMSSLHHQNLCVQRLQTGSRNGSCILQTKKFSGLCHLTLLFSAFTFPGCLQGSPLSCQAPLRSDSIFRGSASPPLLSALMCFLVSYLRNCCQVQRHEDLLLFIFLEILYFPPFHLGLLATLG